MSVPEHTTTQSVDRESGRASVKLIRNSRGYNWEIKAYEESDPVAVGMAAELVRQLNDEFLAAYGGGA